MTTKFPRLWALFFLAFLPWLGMGGSVISFADEGTILFKDEKNPGFVDVPQNLVASLTGLASETSATPTAILATPSVPVLPSAAEMFGDNLEKIDQINEGLVYSWRLTTLKSEEAIETLKGVFATAIKEDRITIIENKTKNIIIARFPDRLNESLRREWGQVMGAIDRTLDQVLLEVLIVELALNDIGQWGADLRGLAESVVGGREMFQMLNMSHTAGTMEGTEKTTEGLKYFVTNGNKLKALIFAGQTCNKARVLSSPQLIASNHKQATFKLGRTVPIQLGSTVTNGVLNYTFQEKTIGINIAMTPHFDTRGRINLDINQEVSDLTDYDPDKRVALTANKTLTSNVTLQSGETVALGGYIQNSNKLNRKRIPGLSSIPFFGKFVNRDFDTNDKIEVIVFITPKILTNNRVMEVSRIAKKDFFTEKEKIVSKLEKTFDYSPMGARQTKRFEKREQKAAAAKNNPGKNATALPQASSVKQNNGVSPAAQMATTSTPKRESIATRTASTTATIIPPTTRVASSSIPVLVSEIRSKLGQ